MFAWRPSILASSSEWRQKHFNIFCSTLSVWFSSAWIAAISLRLANCHRRRRRIGELRAARTNAARRCSRSHNFCRIRQVERRRRWPAETRKSRRGALLRVYALICSFCCHRSAAPQRQTARVACLQRSKGARASASATHWRMLSPSSTSSRLRRPNSHSLARSLARARAHARKRLIAKQMTRRSFHEGERFYAVQVDGADKNESTRRVNAPAAAMLPRSDAAIAIMRRLVVCRARARACARDYSLGPATVALDHFEILVCMLAGSAPREKRKSPS